MRRHLGLTLPVAAIALATAHLPAQTGPRLASYFTEIPVTTLLANYKAIAKSPYPATADLNGDGNDDLVVFGWAYPINGNTDRTPQPGYVFLGDGNGRFTPAPTNLFPIDTLFTMNVRQIRFADFNKDGRDDMFLATTGWDSNVPTPQQGEQNRLFLSRPDGGWRDVTNELPRLEDYTHALAVGDISGRGVIDVFVGNGFGGRDNIRPYTLLNTGSGQFVQVSANIPAGPGQILDPVTFHQFVGANLVDLDGDGLPELVVGVTFNSLGGSRLTNSVIFWNRAGGYAEADRFDIPAPPVFRDRRSDHDMQRIDINGDNLPDLVLVGLQPPPTVGSTSNFSGWFVQLLVNQGNHQFEDETALRIPAGEWWGGADGAISSAPVPRWVRTLDFNRDGYDDFALEWNFGGGRTAPEIPIVYINDGTGHYTTYKVGDLIPAGREFTLGSAHIFLTKNGYGFINPLFDSSSPNLRVSGLVANERKLPGVGR